MSQTLPSRDDAWALLNEYTSKSGLIKHALGVEGTMRWYAAHTGQDAELWGHTGLLHDFDYERWPSPEDHPFRGVEILEAKGYPEILRTAILGHAPYSGVPRETLLAKALFACDELSGFVVATALIKPSKSLSDVDVKGVTKRLKQKAFARGVNREDVYQGAEELCSELDLTFETHVGNVIEALQGISDELGLC